MGVCKSIFHRLANFFIRLNYNTRVQNHVDLLAFDEKHKLSESPAFSLYSNIDLNGSIG